MKKTGLYLGATKLFARIVPTEIVLKLPYKCTRKSMNDIVYAALDAEAEPRSTKYSIDFSQIAMADPVAITILSNLIEFLLKKNVKIDYKNYGLRTDGNTYLDDSGFFLRYLGKQIFQSSSLRRTTLPLECIKHDRSYSWIENQFSPWIESKVRTDADSFGVIKVCFGEVFNNILDHSGEKVGCVFAQHFQASKEIVVAVSDFGRGIPANVKKQLPSLTDAHAILKATEEGFTTKSTNRNQGAGLAILVKNVVQFNKGKVLINSFYGSVNCFQSASGTRKVPAIEKFPYPGTLIEMRFKTDLLESTAQKEVFTW